MDSTLRYLSFVTGPLFALYILTSDYVPPIFNTIHLGYFVLLVLILLIIFIRTDYTSPKRIGRWIAISGLFSIIYIGLFKKTTYLYEDKRVNVHIGFGAAPIGLSDKGKAVYETIEKESGDVKLEEFIKYFPYNPSSEKQIWVPEIITTTTILLCVVYILTSVFWGIFWTHIMILILKEKT
jgi:hypothetical protein